MSIEQSYGFRSAQRAYDNATPFDGECTCEELFTCPECGEELAEGAACKERDCEGAVAEPTDRDGMTPGNDPKCPDHGYCTGCTSRHCEDCGGDYDEDR